MSKSKKLDNVVMELIDNELIPALIRKRKAVVNQNYGDASVARDNERIALKLIMEHLGYNENNTLKQYPILFDYISGVRDELIREEISSSIHDADRLEYLKSLVRDWNIEKLLDN
jgi:hypothetical protein